MNRFFWYIQSRECLRMAKVTLQNVPPDHWTCEECGGILNEAKGTSEHGGCGFDIPCPYDMNAENTYGLAKECTYGERQKEKRLREHLPT